MRSSIILLSLLVGLCFSCLPANQESGVSSIQLKSVEDVKAALVKANALKDSDTLDKVVVILKRTGKSDDGMNCSKDWKYNDATEKIPLKTGKNKACTYKLDVTYGNETNPELFKGSATIGKGQDFDYEKGKTIQIKIKLYKQGDKRNEAATVDVANVTSSDEEFDQDASLDICYGENCSKTTADAKSENNNVNCMAEAKRIAQKELNVNVYTYFCYKGTDFNNKNNCDVQMVIASNNADFPPRILKGCNDLDNNKTTYILAYKKSDGTILVKKFDYEKPKEVGKKIVKYVDSN